MNRQITGRNATYDFAPTPLSEQNLLDEKAQGHIYMSIFKAKVLLITGGTGSFGNAVLNRFLRTDIGDIRIFSRDEKKQDDMRHDFQASALK